MPSSKSINIEIPSDDDFPRCFSTFEINFRQKQYRFNSGNALLLIFSWATATGLCYSVFADQKMGFPRILKIIAGYSSVALAAVGGFIACATWIVQDGTVGIFSSQWAMGLLCLQKTWRDPGDVEVDSVLRDVVAPGSFTQPADHQKVFKDECAYCFKTPFWAGGLFVSLKSYHSFCREHAEYYANLTGDKLFVQMESTKKLEEENQGQEDRAADGEPTSKMTKLTIEAEPKYTYEDKYRVVVHPNYEAPISKEQAKKHGGKKLFKAIRVVEESTSAERLLMLTQRDNGWDEDVKLTTNNIYQKWERAKCCEDGVALESAYGPGNTGLVNIGSTCYLNSVLQVLYRIDSFRARFAENATEIFSKTPIDRLRTDFNAQFAKVFSAMLSGNYASEEDKEHNGIRPRQFKRTAAGNHPEFSTAKQQDTDEYIRHIIQKVSTNNRDDDPTDALK
ncbi:unnamed protein product [Caenorhabditis sp. 36 PRJEB53466]|nr:unnamed protein product [Caenorhabditis sp. 36 PRJEB53466]